MPFSAEKFARASITHRTREVKVPELADFYGGGEDPVWLVRGLSANEVAKSERAKTSHRLEESLVEALKSGSQGEIVRNLQTMLGRSADQVEPDTARRIEILAAGSVEPACSVEIAVRIAETHPVVFYTLTNAILELTGKGGEIAKKPKRSGETPPSEPQ
jgi:hypothetical protein